jgi:PTH1 family peptidyl-tRNA hydrolase
MDAAAFVLRDFSAVERKDLDLEIDRAADAVETLIAQGLERAQNTFNG